MPPSEREIPEVTGEEEILPPQREDVPDPNLPKANKFRPEEIKFQIGSKTLGWCMFLMLICIGLSIWKPENELIKSGFEAFKLFAMTILGYMFGSNSIKSE